MRLLVAHPVFAQGLQDADIDALRHAAPDGGEMLVQLIAAAQALGSQPTFAALAEQLRARNADFDWLIAEIAAEGESNPDTALLELAGAIRQTKLKILKAEQERLAGAGLTTEEAKSRYRELSVQQEQLKQQARAEATQR